MDIVVEQPQHAEAIEHLLDLSFGPNRHGKTVYRLREGVAPLPELCLVAVADGRVEGTIRYWPVRIGGATPALLLGPIAVLPERRSEGLGGHLIRYSLNRAAAAGHRIVLLVGDAPYYGKFGFTRALTQALTLPGPVELDRFLGLELVPGALAGVSGVVMPWTAHGLTAPAPSPAAADLPPVPRTEAIGTHCRIAPDPL